MEVVALGQLVGQRLLGVTAAVHEFEGARAEEPVHLWLHLDGLGAIKCHCAGSGALDLRAEQPYVGYDMQEHGRVLVVPSDSGVLAAHTGEVVQSVTPLWQQPPGISVGLALTFVTGTVGLANLGDSLVVGAWPGAFTDEGVFVTDQE
jgi:hypothetical protein